jgi:hypothetical protein
MAEFDAFTTDWGTFNVKEVQDALRADPTNRLLNAASDMIDIMMGDHKAMQAKRDKRARLEAELAEMIDGEDGE